MRRVAAKILRLVVQLAAIGGVFGDTLFVTDLDLFNSLAPCAASALSYVVQGYSSSKCPAGVTALQTCVCTKDQNLAAVQTAVSSSILSYYCTKTATADVSSAEVVLNYYCQQSGSPSTFSNAAVSSVSQFISDLPAYSSLAPCATYGVSAAVQGLGRSACPTSDAGTFASCVCSKNQNSQALSGLIVKSVNGECGSTHAEDVTSAQAVFAGYCGLLSGVSSFPTASALPGKVSYYVTDLPDFSSLAPCAASGVSYAVLGQTSSFCPSDPEAFVSCACVKDKNSMYISSLLVSEITEYCGSKASADVTSGLSVFGLYCSAGNGAYTPTGVTNSVQPTSYGAASTGAGSYPSGATKTGVGNSSPTGSGSGSGSSGSGSGSSGSGSGSSVSGPSSSEPATSKPNVPLIAGVAGGATVVAVVAIVSAIWFCRRRKRYPELLPHPSSSPYGENTSFTGGKAELDNTAFAADQSPNKDVGFPSPTPISAVSPDSIYAKPTTVPELQSQQSSMVRPTAPGFVEMPGRNPSEMQGQGIAMHTISPNPSEIQGHGMGVHMASPNPSAYEMQGHSPQMFYGQALGSPPQQKGSGGPPYAQPQEGPPFAQAQGGPPPYPQSQGGAWQEPNAGYVPHYGQGYGPPPNLHQNPDPNPSQGVYEMAGQRWD